MLLDKVYVDLSVYRQWVLRRSKLLLYVVLTNAHIILVVSGTLHAADLCVQLKIQDLKI